MSHAKPHHAAQFARGPNDAIQCYADLLSTNRKLEPYIGHGLDGHFKTWLDYEDYRGPLLNSPVFFWSKETAQVVYQASVSYPLTGDMYLPHLTRAFCVFERPIFGVVVEGEALNISALSWSVNKAIKHDLAIVLRMIAFVWHGSLGSPVWWMDVGSHWLREPSDPTWATERDRFLRWILTASMFVEQEILVGESVRPGKPFLRRMVAEHPSHEPNCHVVTLRRQVGMESARKPDSGAGVDWRYQWIVRGHWRNQYYPKAERHVPIFISPYLKGPEDKPLKAPKPTVFAVNR